MSKLPQFISGDTSSDNSLEAPEINTSWASKNINKIMMWFSVAWFAIVLIYITKYFGWSNLFLMMPDEFGGFLAGVTLPLGAIWVVMAYIDRGTNFKNEAKFLRAYMNQLVYPEEGGAQTAKAMADAIRSQVIELQEVTKEANAQTFNIKQGLEAKIEEFSKLVGILENYSSKTMEDFSSNVENVVTKFEYVNQSSIQAANNLKTTLQDFAEISHNVSTNINGLFSSLSPQIQELKTYSVDLSAINSDSLEKMEFANKIIKEFSQKSVSNINELSKELYEQTSKLEQASQLSVNKIEEMSISLDGRVKELGKTLENQSKTVIANIKDIDKANDQLAKRMGEQGQIISQEVDKVVTRSSFVAETIESQVANFATTSDNVISEMSQLSKSLQNTSSLLDDKVYSSLTNINNVITAIDDSANKVEIASQRSLSTAEAFDHELSLKTAEWNNRYLEVVQKFDEVSKDVEQKVKDLKDSSLQATDEIKEVGLIMDKYSNDITQTASLVVAQSKQSEVSLTQQQKNVTASIASLEGSRAEIKKQIEELSRAAVVINDEAVVAINNLKSQMEETLRSSEDVVVKTRVIGDSLKSQSQDFEKATTTTLNTMDSFNTTLNSHYKELSKVTTGLEDKSAYIYNTLEKQIELVDEKTEQSSKQYESILSLFNEQTNILNSVTDKTVGYVSDIVSSLDDKAEAINALFNQQKENFNDFCDKLSDNTTNISQSIKKHTQGLEQSADKAIAKLNLLEDDVYKRADIISQVALASIDKMSGISKSIEDTALEASSKVNEAEKAFIKVSTSVLDNVTFFENTVKGFEETSTTVNTNITQTSSDLTSISSQLSQEAKNIYDTLAVQNTSLEAFLVRVQAQAENLKEVFDNQKETLTDVANVVATQTRLGENSLNQQYKILSEASTEVSQKLTEIQTKFKTNMDSVTDVSSKIAYEISTLGDRLINISEDVEKSSKVAVKNVQSVNLALTTCEEELESSITKSSQKLGGVVKDYEGYIANFNTVTAEASSGVFEINNLILDQSDKMIKISEDTKDLVTCFNTVLNDTSVELSNRANFAFEKVKGLGDNLKQLSTQLEEAGNLGAKHLVASGDKLRAQMSEIVSNAERISNSILGSGDTFLKQSDVLVVTTDDALIKVKNIMEKMDESSKTFLSIGDITTQKTANFSDLVDAQVKTLAEVASKADKKLNELVKTYDGHTTDAFLKESAFVIETLETAAVDMARLIKIENSEDLWKKYYNGDNSVFVRYLSKNLNKAQVALIKKTFEENHDFRKVVTRYLSEFEDLLAKAQNNERAGILLSVITSADIGKIYYVIAKALDKLN